LANSSGKLRTIVFAGGGIETKGAEVLLEAVPFILRHVDRLRILVVGTGEEHILEAFRQYAPEVHVVGRIPFEEIGHVFSLSDMVLVPSTCAESFSLVTLESLQVGTPVVGSDLGGIPELIRDGETGYLFPVGDAVVLAERVIHHFARPAYVRRQMRRFCVEDTRTRFPLERHVEGTLQVYQEALAI
jgi:glycosyltransferase involved in cell wall biosynthesis